MGCTFPLRQVLPPDRAARLRLEVEPLLALQRSGHRTISISKEIDATLPYRGLPLGCVHEVQSPGLASGIAYAALLAGRIPTPNGQLIYIAPDQRFHPLGLLPYGGRPERWIHIRARSQQDLAWTALEALRCPQVSAVLAAVKTADLTLCRRFQLAAEGSGSTGFLLTGAAEKPAVASAITRWRVSPIPAPPDATFEEPCWDLGLAYCRGGRAGSWRTVWRNGQLEPLEPAAKTVAPQPVERTPTRRLAG